MSDVIREWGVKLLLTKLKLAGSPIEFFRQHQIYKWNLQESVTHCAKIYSNVLWMRILEQSEGMRLPNNCRDFTFIPFYSKLKNYYRFRNVIVKESDFTDCDKSIKDVIKRRPWEYRTLNLGGNA